MSTTLSNRKLMSSGLGLLGIIGGCALSQYLEEQYDLSETTRQILNWTSQILYLAGWGVMGWTATGGKFDLQSLLVWLPIIGIVSVVAMMKQMPAESAKLGILLTLLFVASWLVLGGVVGQKSKLKNGVVVGEVAALMVLLSVLFKPSAMSLRTHIGCVGKDSLAPLHTLGLTLLAALLSVK